MNEVQSNPEIQNGSQVDACIRDNPTRSLLIAVGIGLALGVAMRVMQSEPPMSRGAAMLRDIQTRLHRLSDRASQLACNGTALLQDGIDQVRKEQPGRGLQRLGKRILNLFH